MPLPPGFKLTEETQGKGLPPGFTLIEDTPQGKPSSYDTVWTRMGETAKRPVELAPFAGTAADIYDIAKIKMAADRLQKDEATQEDIDLVQSYLDKESRPKTFGYKVADVVAQIPAFAGEMYFTGGLAAAGKAAAFQTAKAASKKILSTATREALTKSLAKTATRKLLTGTAKKIAGGLVAGSVQSLPAGALRTIKGTLERTGPQINLDGSISGGQDLLPAAKDAAVSQWIETVSERSGGLLGEAAKYIPEKYINSAIVRALKKANPLANNERLKKVVEATQWHGVWGEFFEERVADVGRAMTGLDEWKLPSAEQIAVELTSFSVPGVGAALAKKALDYSKSKGEVAKEGAKEEGITKGAEGDIKVPVFPKTVKFTTMAEMTGNKIFSTSVEKDAKGRTVIQSAPKQNIRENFTADENTRMDTMASSILQDAKIISHYPKAHIVHFNEMEPTIKDNIVNILFENKDQPQEKQTTDVINYVQELRNSPQLFLSGVDKKSEIVKRQGKQIFTAINPATEIYFSPFMAKVPLTRIAQYLVGEGIPVEKASVHQLVGADQVEIAKQVHKTLEIEFNRQAKLQRNAREAAAVVDNVRAYDESKEPSPIKAEIQPKVDTAALSKFFKGKKVDTALPSPTQQQASAITPEIVTEAPRNKEVVIRDIIEGQLGSTVLSNEEAIEYTDTKNVLTTAEKAKLLKVLDLLSTREDEYTLQTMTPQERQEFYRQRSFVADKAIEAILGKPKGKEAKAVSESAVEPTAATENTITIVPQGKGEINGMRGPLGEHMNTVGMKPGKPGWLGNPIKWAGNGGKGTLQDAIAGFKQLFLKKVESNPEFRQAVLDLRGKRIGYYRPNDPNHLQVIQEWLEGIAEADAERSAYNEESSQADTARLNADVILTGKSPYLAKDQLKADKANKFIGRGSFASSTAQYAKNFGDKANMGTYAPSDVVFISAEGNRTGRVKPDFGEIQKAIDAGATLITDNQENRKRPYNIGEREVADFLIKGGYIEQDGTWKRSQPVAAAEAQDKLSRAREETLRRAIDDSRLPQIVKDAISKYVVFVDRIPPESVNDPKLDIVSAYDPAKDKIIISLDHMTEGDVAKKVAHEFLHRGFVKTAEVLGGLNELYDIFSKAKDQLMEVLPDLLKSTGHTSLEELVADYKIDLNTQAGQLQLWQELAGRWAENLAPQPVRQEAWYDELLDNLAAWIKSFVGIESSRKEVNRLVSGLVVRGSLDAIPEQMQEGSLYREPELKVDEGGDIIKHPLVSDALKNYSLTLQDKENAMKQGSLEDTIIGQIYDINKTLHGEAKGKLGKLSRYQAVLDEIARLRKKRGVLLYFLNVKLNRDRTKMAQALQNLPDLIPEEIRVMLESTPQRLTSEIGIIDKEVSRMTWPMNVNSPSRLKKEIDVAQKEIARLSNILKTANKQQAPLLSKINTAYKNELNAYLEQMTPYEKALVSGKTAAQISRIIQDIENKGLNKEVKLVDDLIGERRAKYAQYFEEELEPGLVVDKGDEKVNLDAQDVAAVEEYKSLAKEAKDAIDESEQKEITRQAYDKRLTEMYNNLSDDARYAVDMGNSSELYRESIDDGTLELGGGYASVTATRPYILKGTVQGKPVTKTLEGTYRIQSVMEDGKVLSGVVSTAESFRIDEVDLTRDQFEEMLRENQRLAEETDEAPLKIDYWGLQMAAKRGKSPVGQNSQKPDNPFKMERTMSARLVLDLLRFAPQGLKGWAKEKLPDEVVRATQRFFAPKQVVENPQKIVEVLYDEKNRSSYFDALAYSMLHGIDRKIADTVRRDHKNSQMTIKQSTPRVIESVKKLLSSAASEIFVKEGDAGRIAVTDVGKQHQHGPGTYLGDLKAEAQGFIERATWMIDFFKIDEQWLRKTYSIPANQTVIKYLSKTRPELFFYKMLAHPNVSSDNMLQRILAYGQSIQTTILRRMMQVGLLSRADMARNIRDGYFNRVFDFLDTQKKRRRATSGGNAATESQVIQARKYRTNEEYLLAAGDWRLPSRDPLGLPPEFTATGRGLFPVDDYVAQLQEYVKDSLKKIDQAQSIEMLRDVEIAPNRKAVYYRHDVEPLAKKAGVSVENWLQANHYVEAKGAPGLVQWYRGAFQEPWVHDSVADIVTNMYGQEGKSPTMWFLNFLRRVQTWNPFDTTAIYLGRMLVSFKPHVYKTFIRNLGRAFPKVISAPITTARRMIRGEYDEDPIQNFDLLPLMMEAGFSGYRFESALRASFSNMDLGKFASARGVVTNLYDYLITAGGISPTIFNEIISRTLYDVTKVEYEAIKKRKPHLSDKAAMKRAVSFVNDASMIPTSAVYAKAGKIYNFIFYSRNLITAPVRMATGAAYGLSKLPGIKGTKAEKTIQSFYKFKTGPLSHYFTPLTHGEKTPEELDDLWQRYAVQLASVFAVKLAVNTFVQYMMQSLRGGPDDDKWMFNNPKGYKFSIWGGARDESNRTHLIEPQYMREVQFLYDMLGPTSIDYKVKRAKNKLNVGLSQLLTFFEYWAKNSDVPLLTEGGKAGWLVDAAQEMSEAFTAMGFERQPEYKGEDQWLKAAQLFGVTVRQGPALGPGESMSMVDRIKAPGKMRDYILDTARRRIVDEGQDPMQVRRELGLTFDQIKNIVLSTRTPLLDLFKRNRKATIQFQKK